MRVGHAETHGASAPVVEQNIPATPDNEGAPDIRRETLPNDVTLYRHCYKVNEYY